MRRTLGAAVLGLGAILAGLGVIGLVTGISTPLAAWIIRVIAFKAPFIVGGGMMVVGAVLSRGRKNRAVPSGTARPQIPESRL